MKPIIVIALAILLVLAFMLWRSSCEKEHFFSDQALPTVLWSAPTGSSGLTYNWAACNNGCDPSSDPSTWPSGVQAIASNSVALTSSNCPGCDFGQKLLFAVQSVDPKTSLVSPWTTAVLDFTSQDTATTALTDQNGNQLAVGSTGFTFTATLSSAIPASNVYRLIYVTLTRGDTVYKFGQDDFFQTNTATSVSYTGSFGSTSPWTAPPGELQNGDVITVSALIAGVLPGGPIYYYGQTTTTVTLVPPGSPTIVGYTINN